MAHTSDWYVNGLDESLGDAIYAMRRFNRRYMREMHTLAQAEKYFEKVDNREITIRQMKQNVRRSIDHRIDPALGKLNILCKDHKRRNYDPDKWSELMARTRSRTLQEEGLHNEMARAGFDLVIVSIGGSGDACRFWEGKILSVTGHTPGYQTVSEAQRIHLFHPNCFVDGKVKVLTQEGKKRIMDVQIGDFALTHKNRYRKVTELHRTEGEIGEALIKLYLTNLGPQPMMTFGHPVLTKKGWKPVETLTQDDDVCVYKKGQIIYDPVLWIAEEELKRKMTKYNLSVKQDESYVVGKGLVVHNCVHSTSPFILTSEDALNVWGRDVLPIQAIKQLRDLGKIPVITGLANLSKRQKVTSEMIQIGIAQETEEAMENIVTEEMVEQYEDR